MYLIFKANARIHRIGASTMSVYIYISRNQLTTNPHVPCHLIFSGAFALILHFVSLLRCTFSAILRRLEVCLHLPLIFFETFIAVWVIRLKPVFDLHVVIPNKKNLRIFRVIATLRTCFTRGHISLWGNLNAQ